MSSTQGQGQGVNVESLSTQQLSSVKKQLDDELEHLTSSFTQLRGAQAKFRECLKSIDNGVSPHITGKPLLVPLTASLYVPGVLADSQNVIVDVGTGFYVEKSTADATTFYNLRVEELTNNLKDLESIVQSKSTNLRTIEEVLRRKVVGESSN